MDILLEFAKEIGLKPKQVASTGGGEFHCACPKCGGTDRFFIQPNFMMKNCIGRYACRQCEVRGDSIQFCRDFLGLDWKEAVDRCNCDSSINNFSKKPKFPFEEDLIRMKRRSEVLNAPPDQWEKRARSFIEWANKQIKKKPDVLDWLDDRGLPMEAVDEYLIGYSENSSSKYGDFRVPFSKLGLSDEVSLGGNPKTLWIPKGIVVPTIEPSTGAVTRIKIRRSDWTIGDKFSKYAAVKGSTGGLNLIGDRSRPEAMAVVESELDGYALHRVVKDFAFVVAVGSNSKNPDLFTDHLAKMKKFLLICHDNDEGGGKMWEKWKKLYPHAKAHPTPPKVKDIGEFVQSGGNLREWILSALPSKFKETK